MPYSIGFALLFAGYAISLGLSYSLPFSIAVQAGVGNLIPAVIGAMLIRLALLRLVPRSGPWLQAMLHAGLAILFALFWLWLQSVLLGSLRAGSLDGFTVRLLAGRGAGWQLMQGLTTYAVIALLVQREIDRRQALSEQPARSGEAAERQQVFVKEDDEFRPLDPARIIFARGADDYVELVTDAGTHLARMTLARCAEQLGANFLRVHRSFVINAARVARVEPSGDGRMLVVMENGETIQTSRAGARLLRERVI